MLSNHKGICETCFLDDESEKDTQNILRTLNKILKINYNMKVAAKCAINTKANKSIVD